MSSGFQTALDAAGYEAMLNRPGLEETLGVSSKDRSQERAAVRKAAGPDAAERVSLRFARVIAAFKEAEGRSPGVDDGEVWKALSQIVKEEISG